MITLPKKVFSSKDLKLLWWTDGNSFKKRLSYWLKKGYLVKLRKWLYVTPEVLEDPQPKHIFQIATSIYSPSYISFETALAYHGINFQYSPTITVAAPYAKEVEIPTLNLKIQFKRLPLSILTNPTWIQKNDNYRIASPLRAICDTLYKTKGHFYFDNLPPQAKKLIQQSKSPKNCYKLLPIFEYHQDANSTQTAQTLAFWNS